MGIDPRRVAEIIVERGAGGSVRGSGYLVADDLVLTAAHVVAGARQIWARFPLPDPDRALTIGAVPHWEDPSDIALVRLSEAHPGSNALASVRFGRLSRRAAVVGWEAVGFPLFQLRDTGPSQLTGTGTTTNRYRDAEHAHGTLAVLSNAREGTFSAVVESATPDTANLSAALAAIDPDRPAPGGLGWEGMSGAAVWVGGRLVGVVSRQHPGSGPRSLAIAPLQADPRDAAPLQADPREADPREADPREADPREADPREADPREADPREADPREVDSREVEPRDADRRDADPREADRRDADPRETGLPDDLPDVLEPTRVTNRVLAAHAADIEAVVPQELIGREAELDAFTTWAAGPVPYAWWSAPPWAGKTALAAWLALRPPVGLEVAAFFVIGRDPGRSGSDAYLVAMIEQLSALADRAVPDLRSAAGRGGAYRELLGAAAEAVGLRGHRLLLVVDGLDEDRSDDGGIAALLPATPPAGMKVFVTSREGYALPRALKPDHQLRRTRRVPLAPSESADLVRELAEAELEAQLASDPRTADILGFLAVCGGGLTQPELGALLGRASGDGRPVGQHEVRRRLTGSLRRTLRERRPPDEPDPLYIYAHDTLHAVAAAALDDLLPEYRQHVDAWADEYRDRGWPDATPPFLIHRYADHLDARAAAEAGTGPALDRLGALVTDRAWQELLFLATGTDEQAFAQLNRALERHGQIRPADPWPLVRLGAHFRCVAAAAIGTPSQLAVTSALLGRWRRALALVRFLDDSEGRRIAQTIATIVAGSGDVAAALEIAESLAPFSDAPSAVLAVAHAAARAGHSQSEGQTDARTKSRTDGQAEGRTDGQTVDRVIQRAVELTELVEPPLERVRMRAEVARFALAAGQPAQAAAQVARALDEATAIVTPYDRVFALSYLVPFRSETPAADLLAELGDLVAGVPAPADRGRALQRLTATAISLGDRERRDAAIDEFLALHRSPDDRHFVIDLVSVLASHDEPELAERILADEPTDPEGYGALALWAIARCWLHRGDLVRALATTAPMTDPRITPMALAEIATAGPAGAEPARAAAARLRSLAEADEARAPEDRGWTTVPLVRALARVGDFDRARALAEACPRGSQRAEALADVAEAAARAGDIALAEECEREAIALVRGGDTEDIRADMLKAMALAYTATGDFDAAIRAAAAAGTGFGLDEAVEGIVAEACARQEFESALAAVGELSSPFTGVKCLMQVAGAAVADQPELADEVIAFAFQVAEEIAETDGSFFAPVIADAVAMGRSELMVELVDGLDRDGLRDRLRAWIAANLARAGRVDEAIELARTIDGWDADDAWRVIATQLGAYGRLDAALRVAANLRGSNDQETTRLDAIAAASRAGFTDDVLSEIEARGSDLNHTEVDRLFGIVPDLVRHGAGGRLRAAIGRHPGEYVPVLLALIDALAAIDRDPAAAADEAIAALRAMHDGFLWIPSGWAREHGADLVRVAVRAGRRDEVLRVVGMVNEWRSHDLLLAAAVAMAEEGAVETAMSIALGLGWPTSRPKALGAIGRALGTRLGGEELESAVRTVFDRELWPQLSTTERAELAADWARMYAHAGRFDDAETIVDVLDAREPVVSTPPAIVEQHVTWSELAVPALLAIAEEHATRSGRAVALGRVLLAGGWNEALPVLAGWDPETFRRVAAADLLPLLRPDEADETDEPAEPDLPS